MLSLFAINCNFAIIIIYLQFMLNSHFFFFFGDSIICKHARIVTNSGGIVVEFIFSYTHFVQNLDLELIIDTRHRR